MRLVTGFVAAVSFSASALAAPDCFETLAQTRAYALGQPTHATPLRDGQHVLFLRSGPHDTSLRLFEYDALSKTERELAAPGTAPENLSVEEKARRERARQTMSGITDFAVSSDGTTLLVSQASKLMRVTLPSGAVTPVPGEGWIAPRLSPDGKYAAVVRDNDLHVVSLADNQDTRLTTGGTDLLTHGLAEFAAAEELDRADGTWWSPDSTKLLFEEADMSGVEPHYIADPANPATKPIEFRYPRADTANAAIRFGLIARTGGTPLWLKLDASAWPYLARVIWPAHGKLTLLVLNRAQTKEALLTVDEATGQTTTLLTESDPAWINLTPVNGFFGRDLPLYLPDGSGFLWAAQRGPQWQLELRNPDGTLNHPITPPDFRYDALNDVDVAHNNLVISGSPDRTSFGLYRVPLSGGKPVPLVATPGIHMGVFAGSQHSLFADKFSTADGQAGTAIRRADGSLVGLLSSKAEIPPALPNVQYLTVGPRQFDADIIRPANFKPGHKYPVILAVYAGPTVKVVMHAPRMEMENQCLADHGFIVVSLDGRGTPGRDHDFERATKNNLIDIPLQDQVDGLQALGKLFPEMDMRHVGVEGWSFGGYFTAMATIRRPDIFSAGVAGAPVVDFADYDTAYTERYLGTPQDDPAGYKASNVLSYAANLARPLLIMHGLTDDNVYFENTVKLTQALLNAGKPYGLLLLPGTHLLPNAAIRARVGETRASFLKDHLR